MSHLALDGPIAKPGEDRLRRLDQVRAIVRMLADTSPAGFVVSVEGGWGSGKTSVLNLIRHLLDEEPEDKRPIFVPFSPWLVGDAGSLAAEFLKQLALGISVPRNQAILGSAIKTTDVAMKIAKYLRYVPGTGMAREALEDLEKALGATKDMLQSAEDGKNPDVNRHKDAVFEALAALDRPVVVVLDDVDRLPPKDVYEVIRLVRAVGDFPRVRYLLALDAGYVEGALEKVGVAQAANFLDKIFLHRFVLPAVFPEELSRELAERLERLAEDAKAGQPFLLPWRERLQVLLDAGLGDLFGTLRDVKVVANRVQLQLALCEDVNLAELAALETLAVKAPAVYRQMLRDPDAYTGAARRGVGDLTSRARWDAAMADRDRVLQETPENLRGAARRTVDLLFPPQVVELGGRLEVGHPDAVLDGLLCSPSRLRIAVSGHVPRNDLRLRDLLAFYMEEGGRREIVARVAQHGWLARFAWLLERWTSRPYAPVQPEDMLARLGELVDDVRVQRQLAVERHMEGRLREIALRLRLRAGQGGEPLLRGGCGVTLSFWEMELLASKDPLRYAGVLLSQQSLPPDQGLDDEALALFIDGLPEHAPDIWLPFVQGRIASGACAELACLRPMCQLRDRLLAHRRGDAPQPLELPPHLWAHVDHDIDRRGRVFYFSRTRLPFAHRAEAETYLARDDLLPHQRAGLMAQLQADSIREDDLLVVAFADLAPYFVPPTGSAPTWPPAF